MSKHDDQASRADDTAPLATAGSAVAGSDRQPLRMHAYYFGFTPTGVEWVDRILSAVAHAGKGYHHTEEWGTDQIGSWGPFRGTSYAEWIQRAAEDAAAVQRDLLEALKNYQNYDLTLEQRQNAAIAAIAKAEGRG